MFAFLTFASFALPLLSTAQLDPTEPAPEMVFKQGAVCPIAWNADTSGKWKDTFIELMTGPNQAMVHLSTVARVDGTDATNTSISISCPAVFLHAAVYFYQFTAAGQDSVWTARFAISDASGATTSPPITLQPDGSTIAWGDGSLVTPGSPPPPTAPPGQLDKSNSGNVLGATTTDAPANSSVATSTPSSSVASSAAPLSSPALNSGTSSSQVPATTPALPLSSSTPSSVGNSTATTPQSNAITNTFPAASALLAAAIFGLVTLY